MHAAARQVTSTPQPSTTGESLGFIKGPTFLAIAGTLVSIALLTFLLRICARVKGRKGWRIDDGLMSIGALCATAILVVTVLLTRFGVHMKTGAWLITLLLVLGTSFAKLSLTVYFLRIVRGRAYRVYMYAMIATLSSLTLIWSVALILRCNPIEAAWDPNLREQKCMSPLVYRNIALFNSSLDAATDLFLAVPSILLFSTFDLNITKRVSIIPLISLGFVACAAAIARIPMIFNVWAEDDMTSDGQWPFVCGVIELTLILIIANVPLLAPLLPTHVRRIPSTSTLRPASASPSTFTSASTRIASRSSKSRPASRSSNKMPPSFRRYHDPASNLTFDIEAPPVPNKSALRASTASTATTVQGHRKTLSGGSAMTGRTSRTARTLGTRTSTVEFGEKVEGIELV